MTKRFSVLFLLFSSFLTLYVYSESMLSINRCTSKYMTAFTPEDYRQTMQTAVIHDYPINGILYPVIGFPSMLTGDFFSLTVIFRLEHDISFSAYEVEYVKIFRTDENGKDEFLILHPAYSDFDRYSYEQYVDKIGPDTWLLRIFVPYRLPEAGYDIALKIRGGEEMISRNAVFFPRYEYEDPTKFIVFSNLQRAGNDLNEDLNFNSGEYPRQNGDPQKGIVDAAFSQFNAGSSHFAVMLGDAVDGIDFQNEYSGFYDLALNLEIPMFAVPGERDLLTRFTSNDIETTTLPEFDGLEYWSKFIAPTNNAFLLGRRYLLLDTNEGSAQKRASEETSGFELKPETLEWLENDSNYEYAAVFGHFTPTGETHSSETGKELLKILADKNYPPVYFSGHDRQDAVSVFDHGSELVENSGIFTDKKMEFISTTPLSGSGNGYLGFRKVEVVSVKNSNAEFLYNDVSYNYTCGRYENCQPDDPEKRGMQSVPAGNMWVKYSWESGSDEKESLFSGGDGSSESVTAEIVNWLPTDEEVTLRFIMPAAKYGYKLDNANFTFADAVASSDLSTVFLTVKGKIPAGSTLDDFYNKNFTKFTDYVTISPSNAREIPTPLVDFPEKIDVAEMMVHNVWVRNAFKFSSLIWQVQIQYMNSDPQIFDFAGGEEIELDDIVQKTFSHNYYLRYTTPDGISGKLGFTIEIEANYDNGCCDWDDDEYDQGTDTGHYSDEDDQGTDADHYSDEDDQGTDADHYSDEDDQGTDADHYSDEDNTSDTDSADSASDSEEKGGSSQKKSGSGCSTMVL